MGSAQREEAFFVRSGAERLATAWHPADPEADTGQGLLICSPLLQEEQFARPVLVALARTLAAAGVSVLRFDYPATGDSTGDPSSVSEAALVGAIVDQFALLSSRVTAEVSLLGVRWGAALARLAASHCPDVARLVLVDPVLDLAGYMDEVLRGKVTQQTVQCGVVSMNRAAMREELAAGRPLEVYGYTLGAHLYTDTTARGAIDLSQERPCRTLVVRMTERGRGKPDPAHPPVLGEALSDAPLELYGGGSECREVMLLDESIWKEPKAWRPHRAELCELVRGWVCGEAGAGPLRGPGVSPGVCGAPAPPPAARPSGRGGRLADPPHPGASRHPSPCRPADGGEGVGLEDGSTQRLIAYEVGGATHRGVLHLPGPGVARRGRAILMLPAGLVGRIGPGGLYAHLARQLVAFGWPVLRVDLPGLGEADGALDAPTRWAAFRQLEEGVHLPDIAASCEWLASETRAEGIVSLGLCGSGVTAALAAADLAAVRGCLLLNPQLMLTDVDDSGQRGGAVFGDAYVAALAPKLLRGRSLLRLLTFRSDWRKIARALVDVVGRRLGRGEALHPFLNLRLVEGLARASAARKPILVALGEWDDNRLKFEAEYLAKAARQRRYACAHDRVTIARADHNFTSPEARVELLAALGAWLDQHFD
jgi:pimeloyl-ACP methyl ester carboxylesterase